jgi:hypothetical protein
LKKFIVEPIVTELDHNDPVTASLLEGTCVRLSMCAQCLCLQNWRTPDLTIRRTSDTRTHTAMMRVVWGCVAFVVMHTRSNDPKLKTKLDAAKSAFAGADALV